MTKVQDYGSYTYGVHAWGWFDDEDLIFGSPLDDALQGGRGDDVIYGGDGNDGISDVTTTWYWIGPAALFFDGSGVQERPPESRLDRAHRIESFHDDDLDGVWNIGWHGMQFHESGDDQFFGGRGDDFLAGYSGDDTLDGGDDNDSVFGGTGNDTVIGGSGNDDLYGNAGNDTLLGGSGVDILLGGTGADFLQGGVGADVIEGGDLAADTLDFQVSQGIMTRAQANATIAAANAGDTVNYENSLAVNVDLERAAQIGGEAQGDTITGVENIDGSRFGDTLRGDNKANVLFGGLGNDTLEGRGGADTLIGDGNVDTASYESSLQAVNVDLVRATQTGGDAAGDTLLSIENVIGSSRSDTIRGDEASFGNRLEGGAGNDTIEGRGGADTLLGGDGIDMLDGGNDNDVLNGGLGNDILRGGTGVDTAEFDSWDTPAAPSGVVFFAPQITIDLDAGTATRALFSTQNFRYSIVETDTLDSIEVGRGSNNADVFIGNSQDNKFFGRDGDDTFRADLGRDTYNGDTGSDTVDYSASSTGVSIDLHSGTTGSGGLAEGDRFESIENAIGTSGNDTIVGNNADNRLSGGRGADTLDGGSGRDTLSGGIGVGRDILIGGADADTFLFQSLDDSRIVKLGVQDIIEDFNVGQDKLDFRALHVDASDVIIRVDTATAASVGIDANGNHTFDEGEFAISVNYAAGQSLTLNDFLL
ncbi:MAG: M10 family metallopeptidase C-terminal domain-containing protein [Bradyrhizobium sp.]|nr:M10 family metallopeptidase C-terminal domain-containing protein [Bradyrhizobium sp.]